MSVEPLHSIEFDASGLLVSELPPQCVSDCSHPGPCDSDVAAWSHRLDIAGALKPVADLARDYLREFGAWDDLDDADVQTLAERVLWVACRDAAENGAWFGLLH